MNMKSCTPMFWTSDTDNESRTLCICEHVQMVCLLHAEPEPLGDALCLLVSQSVLQPLPMVKTVNASSQNKFPPLGGFQRWGEVLRQVRGAQSRDVPPVHWEEPVEGVQEEGCLSDTSLERDFWCVRPGGGPRADLRTLRSDYIPQLTRQFLGGACGSGCREVCLGLTADDATAETWSTINHSD